MRPATIAIIVLPLAFVAGVYFALGGHRDANAPDIPGFLWPDPPHIEPFTLDRAGGGQLSEQDLTGHWTLLFFGFTNCPDICPTTMNTLRQVLEKAREGGGTAPANTQVLFVSVDPERDDPAHLRQYIDFFDPAIIGATADDERLKAFARQFGVLYMKIDTANEKTYTMDHSASVLLVDPNLNFVGVFSAPHEAQDIVSRFAAIADYTGNAP